MATKAKAKAAKPATTAKQAKADGAEAQKLTNAPAPNPATAAKVINTSKSLTGQGEPTTKDAAGNVHVSSAEADQVQANPPTDGAKPVQVAANAAGEGIDTSGEIHGRNGAPEENASTKQAEADGRPYLRIRSLNFNLVDGSEDGELTVSFTNAAGQTETKTRKFVGPADTVLVASVLNGLGSW